MVYNPDFHHRHSIRIKGYDYSSPGFYFITICSRDRQPLFGEIKNGEMVLSELGKIIQKEWFKIIESWSGVELDYFIIMPNHLHGIIIITNKLERKINVNDEVGATLAVAQNVAVAQNRAGATPAKHVFALGDVVGGFKSICVNKYLQYIKNNNLQESCLIWQRNYYDHIIRNEKDLYNIQGYILNNVSKWQYDLENLQLYKYWSEKTRELEVKRHYDELFMGH